MKTTDGPRVMLLTMLRDALISGEDYAVFRERMTAILDVIGPAALARDEALGTAADLIRRPDTDDEVRIAVGVLTTLDEEHPAVLDAVARSETRISRDEAMGHLADAAQVLRDGLMTVPSPRP